MQKERNKQFGVLAVLAVALCGWFGVAAADTTSSAHYQASETQFNSGSALQNCSTNYCSKPSLGDSTVGNASSASYYTAQFGSVTSNVPVLEVITEEGTENLGVLDTDHTATATRYIKVRNYLSQGYVIQLSGDPPTQGVHQLNTITTPSTSHAGAEQFGVNMVANTAPSLGADPVQVPSGATSFGYATSDYATANLFKYVKDDIVARSDKSSGETDYTLSIIVNVSNNTPGGHYSGNYSAVVVPTY